MTSKCKLPNRQLIKCNFSTDVTPQQQPYKSYKPKRMLPHIAEQYQYRITNELLMNRIIHPKRDRIIMDSLLKAEGSPVAKMSRSIYTKENRRRKVPQKSLHKLREAPAVVQKVVFTQNQSKGEESEDNQISGDQCTSKIINFRQHKINKQFLKSGQNTFNLFTNNQNTFEQSQSAKSSYVGKIKKNICHRSEFSQTINKQNNPSESTLQNDATLVKTQKFFIRRTGNQNKEANHKAKQNRYSTQSFQSNTQQTTMESFGRGSTHIKICNLMLNCRPELPDDTLLILQIGNQIILSQSNSRSKTAFKKSRDNFEKNQSQELKSDPTFYRQFKAKKFKGIIFGINIRKFNEQIPLKIYKFKGLECQLLGILLLPIDIYAKRLQIQRELKHLPPQIFREMKLNSKGEKIFRDVFHDKVTDFLKGKRGVNTNISASIMYQVSQAKFAKINM